MKIEKLLIHLKNPKFIFAFLLILLTLFVFFKSSDYGLTWDISARERYGKSIIKWYASMGKDDSFLNLGRSKYYGPFFEVIATGIEHVFSPYINWIYTRAVVDGLTGVVGVALFMLIGFELKRPWMGILSGIFILLFPRYLGSMFYNSKDIPFLVGMTFVSWTALKLVNNWNKNYIRYSILLGISIALVTCVRIGGFGWYPILFITDLIWWIFNFKNIKNKKGELIKHIKVIIIVLTISYSLILILWPFLLLGPISHIVETIDIMGKYPQLVNNLFEGNIVESDKLPWYYVYKWYLIATPLITLISFFIGIGIYIMNVFKKRDIEAYRLSIFLVYILFFIFLIFKDSPNFYDSFRQTYFLILPIIIFSSYGVFELSKILIKKDKTVFYIFICILILGMSSVIKDYVLLHPYEYTYFNELVGGLGGAYKNYDSDYWSSCNMESAKWLNDNYKKYSKLSNPTYYASADPEQTTPYINKNFSLNKDNPDFYISFTRGDSDKLFPTYRDIFEVKRENTTLCVIKTIK